MENVLFSMGAVFVVVPKPIIHATAANVTPANEDEAHGVDP